MQEGEREREKKAEIEERLRKDRTVPEVQGRKSNDAVGGGCKYLYVQLYMYRYKEPIQTDDQHPSF